MRAWLDALAPRDRRALLALAAALAAALFYGWVWQPAMAREARLAEVVAERRALVAWLRGAAREVAALKGGGGAAAAQGLGGQSLLAVADRTAREARLAGSLKRVEPEGSGGVQVWLEDAPFDELLRWLGRLHEQFGVEAAQLSLDRQERPGRVNARLTLTAAAS